MSQELELTDQKQIYIEENVISSPDQIQQQQLQNEQPLQEEQQQNNKSHLYLLLLKNLLVYKRQSTMTAFLFMSPVIICFLIVLWQSIVDNFKNFLILNPPIRPILSQIPLCRGYTNCTSVGYFVLGRDEPWINQTMEKVSDSESLRFGKDVKLLGVYSNPQEITQYLRAHQNMTQIAVVFCTESWQVNTSPQVSIPCKFNYLQPEKLILYTILYNYTLLYKSPYLSDMRSSYPKDDIATRLKVSLDNALIDVFTDIEPSPYMDIYTQDYPSIPNRFIEGIDVAGNYGAFYFFMPYLLGFLYTVNELLIEKGRKLRQGLVIVGLSHWTYWSSWALTAAIKVLALTITLIITGLIFQFDLFLKTPLIILFILFYTFGFAIQLVAFFIATVCPDVKNGYTIAYGFILIAIVMQMFFTQSALTILFYRGDSTTYVQTIRAILSLYPAFKYSMIYADISQKSCKHYSLDENRWVEGTGYTYSDIFDTQQGQMQLGQVTSYSSPSVIENYLELLASCLFYTVLTYYFDHVLTSNRGKSEPLLFFIYQPLQRVMGLFNRRFGTQNIQFFVQEQELIQSQIDGDRIMDPKATADDEKIRVIQNHNQGKQVNGLRIVGLSKIYNKYPFGIQSIEDVHALKEIYLQMDRGELLSLLGHNGAGKTTLIGLLTGMYEPSSGVAQIMDYDINTQISEVRKIIGVCPQFDILWDQLTAAEHLRMYAAIKEVPRQKIEQEVDDRLKDVDLTHVKNAQVGTFSGGMKRRVSLAISAVGNPRVIILDEPTTGMDPKARRQVWQVIKNMKSDRVVLLTTHAMEEADALADRIAVMADGRLKCIGSSLFLKNVYSDGYRLNVVCDSENRVRTIILLIKLMKDAKLQDQSGGSLVFSVPLNQMTTLRAFFEIVEHENSIHEHVNKLDLEEANELRGLIKEWGLSHATLEEVFMRVTKKQD